MLALAGNFKAYSKIVCRPCRRRGARMNLSFVRVKLPPLPMSRREAQTIYSMMEPGILHQLHKSGCYDLVALRAVEVAQATT